MVQFLLILIIVILFVVIIDIEKHRNASDKPLSSPKSNVHTAETNTEYESGKTEESADTEEVNEEPIEIPEPSEDKKIELNKYIDFLLEKIDYTPLGNFSFPSELILQLEKDCNQSLIEKLVKIVLKETKTNIGNLSVVVDTVKQNDTFAGLYKNCIGKEEIFVSKSSSYLYEKYLAIILHECTHKILLSKNIELPITEDNEKLTDIATLVLGVKDYDPVGYLYQIGYVTYPEMIYAKKQIELKCKEYNQNLISEIKKELFCVSSLSSLCFEKMKNKVIISKPQSLNATEFITLQKLLSGELQTYIEDIFSSIDTLKPSIALKKHYIKLQQYKASLLKISRCNL